MLTCMWPPRPEDSLSISVLGPHLEFRSIRALTATHSSGLAQISLEFTKEGHSCLAYPTRVTLLSVRGK